MAIGNYISKKEFAQYGKEVSSSKKSATDFLMRIGLIDEKGNLREEYYGRILSYDPSARYSGGSFIFLNNRIISPKSSFRSHRVPRNK